MSEASAAEEHVALMVLSQGRSICPHLCVCVCLKDMCCKHALCKHMNMVCYVKRFEMFDRYYFKDVLLVWTLTFENL